VSLAGDYATSRARDDRRQEHPAPGRGAARRDGDLGRFRVVDADTFERPIYAGNAMQTVKSKDPPR
jgi:electron transfer flavoprotein alpha subunit